MARFNKAKERNSFIVESFEEFYYEVLKHKEYVLSNPWKKNTGDSESSPNATAEFILSKLQAYLEEQSMKAGYGGDSFAQNFYQEAQFIMVALADEVFLNLNWPGKAYWESNILEQRFYGTHSAGQTFFDKLDLLIANRDPVKVELAVIFLNALGLGFQGKYRHIKDGQILENYRKALFTFINRRAPYLFDKKIHLFPDTYSHTLEGREPKELPNLRNWYFIFLGIGLTYLLASYIIWYSATSDIMDAANRIIASHITIE